MSASRPGNLLDILESEDKSLSIENVQQYLSKGGNPNVQDKNGNTLLHLAAKAHNEDAVKELLKFGADPDITNNDGNKPAYMATYFNPNIVNNPIAKLLESMSTAIRTFFGTQRAMKQADFMIENNSDNIEKIIGLNHTSSDLLQAFVVRAAEKKSSNPSLLTILDKILENRQSRPSGTLNFLQDSRVISKICDRLKEIDGSDATKAKVIATLQEINTKERTVNYKMLEQAKETRAPGSLKSSSLWQGTKQAAKEEYDRVKGVVRSAISKRNK